MNKWQIICPVVLLVVAGVIMFHQQGAADGRALKSAVNRQLDAHSRGIAALLAKMSTNDASDIEEAAYLELQRPPSTSLISRSDIAVTRKSDDQLQCVIDASRWGISPCTIQQATTHISSYAQ